MKRLPQPSNVKDFTKLISSVVKKNIKSCPKALEEDLCNTVYAYFLTEAGQKVLNRSETISFLKKQIYYRVFDALKEIKKPLKTSILESDYLSDPAQGAYYDHEIDHHTDTALQFIERQSTLELCELLIKEVKKLPKVRQSDFVCYQWEALAQMCELLGLDSIMLVEKVQSPLPARQIVKIFDRCTNHVERAELVLYPNVNDPKKLAQKENNYRRNAIRGLEDLNGLFKQILD